MQNLTSRQHRLLKLLLQAGTPLALAQLAQQLTVSEKVFIAIYKVWNPGCMAGRRNW